MAKKLQQLVKDALASVYPALDAMTDAQLRNVRAATVKLNGTNCWWLAHAWAPELADIAGGMLRARYAERRKAKRKTPNA